MKKAKREIAVFFCALLVVSMAYPIIAQISNTQFKSPTVDEPTPYAIDMEREIKNHNATIMQAEDLLREKFEAGTVDVEDFTEEQLTILRRGSESWCIVKYIYGMMPAVPFPPFVESYPTKEFPDYSDIPYDESLYASFQLLWGNYSLFALFSGGSMVYKAEEFTLPVKEITCVSNFKGGEYLWWDTVDLNRPAAMLCEIKPDVLFSPRYLISLVQERFTTILRCYGWSDARTFRLLLLVFDLSDDHYHVNLSNIIWYYGDTASYQLFINWPEQ